MASCRILGQCSGRMRMSCTFDQVGVDDNIFGLGGQVRDVDEPGWPLDIILHQIDEVCASGNELRCRVVRDLSHRVRDVRSARVFKVIHGLSPMTASAC